MAIVLSKATEDLDIEVDGHRTHVAMLIRRGGNFAAVRLGAEEAVILANALIEAAGGVE